MMFYVWVVIISIVIIKIIKDDDEDINNCKECGQICFDNKYPEIVFRENEKVICEDCSIDFEEIDGKLRRRKEYD